MIPLIVRSLHTNLLLTRSANGRDSGSADVPNLLHQSSTVRALRIHVHILHIGYYPRENPGPDPVFLVYTTP